MAARARSLSSAAAGARAADRKPPRHPPTARRTPHISAGWATVASASAEWHARDARAELPASSTACLATARPAPAWQWPLAAEIHVAGLPVSDVVRIGAGATHSSADPLLGPRLPSVDPSLPSVVAFLEALWGRAGASKAASRLARLSALICPLARDAAASKPRGSVGRLLNWLAHAGLLNGGVFRGAEFEPRDADAALDEWGQRVWRPAAAQRLLRALSVNLPAGSRDAQNGRSVLSPCLSVRKEWLAQFEARVEAAKRGVSLD